jgi:hypothetical protein
MKDEGSMPKLPASGVLENDTDGNRRADSFHIAGFGDKAMMQL